MAVQKRESLLTFALRFLATTAFIFGAGVLVGVGIHDFKHVSEAWHEVRAIGAAGWGVITSAALALATFGALVYAIRGFRVAERALVAETTPLLMCDNDPSPGTTVSFPVGARVHNVSFAGVFVAQRSVAPP
jgi:hypothetical protein